MKIWLQKTGEGVELQEMSAQYRHMMYFAILYSKKSGCVGIGGV